MRIVEYAFRVLDWDWWRVEDIYVDVDVCCLGDSDAPYKLW